MQELRKHLNCRCTTMVVVAVCGLGAVSAAAWPADPRPLLPRPGVPVYRFEEDVPVEFRPDHDSHLTLNHRWYRGEGDTSLRWDWDRRGSSFEIRCPSGFPDEEDLRRPAFGTGVPRLLCAVVPVFSAWVYNETPHNAMLSIEIRGGAETLHLFFVSLDFSGWKELRLPYGAGLPAPADRIRIVAPEPVYSGTLYFDELSPWRDALTWRESPRRTTLWPTPSSPDLIGND